LKNNAPQVGLTFNEILEVAGNEYSAKEVAKLHELCIDELEKKVLEKQKTESELVSLSPNFSTGPWQADT
jgi:hypothetical protein